MSIENLHEGVDSSSLHDLDSFISSTPPPATIPREFSDGAETLLAEHAKGKQFTIEAVMALAGLIFQLYSYFKDHRAARFIVTRAVSHPHGFAAQLINRKVEEKLPPQFRSMANMPAGISAITDDLLVKANI